MNFRFAYDDINTQDILESNSNAILIIRSNGLWRVYIKYAVKNTAWLKTIGILKYENTYYLVQNCSPHKFYQTYYYCFE